MLEFLPQEIRDGLALAKRRAAPRQRRLALHLGDDVHPILQLWADGFSIDASRLSRLRGRVDIHEGARHILACLIVASEIENGLLICTFKNTDPVLDRPPADYELDPDRVMLRLPRH